MFVHCFVQLFCVEGLLMFAEEVILYTLDEIFPRTEVKYTLESRVRVEPLSAHHLCILEVKAIIKDVYPGQISNQIRQ